MTEKSKVLELIDEKIEKFNIILDCANHNNPYKQQYRELYDDTKLLIHDIFSKEEMDEFERKPPKCSMPFYASESQEVRDEKIRKIDIINIKKCISCLKAYRNRVQNFWDEEPDKSEKIINMEQLKEKLQPLDDWFVRTVVGAVVGAIVTHFTSS